jgi:hypothetical protein
VSRKKITRKPAKPASPDRLEAALRSPELAEAGKKYAFAELDPEWTAIKRRLSVPDLLSMVRAAEQGKKSVKTWFWIDQLARQLLKRSKYRPLSAEFRSDLPFEKAYTELRKFYNRHLSDIKARMKELQKK